VEIILQRLLPGQLNQWGKMRMIYSTHDLGPHTYKKNMVGKGKTKRELFVSGIVLSKGLLPKALNNSNLNQKPEYFCYINLRLNERSRKI